MTGNGYNGTIVNGGEWKLDYLDKPPYPDGYTYSDSENIYNFKLNFNNCRSIVNNVNWENGGLNLSGNSYVLCDAFEYNDTHEYNYKLSYEDNRQVSGSDSGFISNKNRLSKIPTGTSKYTMEIVFYYKGIDGYSSQSEKVGLIGMGTYNWDVLDRTPDSLENDSDNFSNPYNGFMYVNNEFTWNKKKRIQPVGTIGNNNQLRDYAIQQREIVMNVPLYLLGISNDKSSLLPEAGKTGNGTIYNSSNSTFGRRFWKWKIKCFEIE